MTDSITPASNNAPNHNVLAFSAGSSRTTATNALPRFDAMSSNGMPAGYTEGVIGRWSKQVWERGEADERHFMLCVTVPTLLMQKVAEGSYLTVDLALCVGVTPLIAAA